MKIKLEYPEGATPLDPNEIGGLKYKHITTQGELDELEQANIASGLRWLARMRRKDILTDDFAIELHHQLFGDIWKWGGHLPKDRKKHRRRSDPDRSSAAWPDGRCSVLGRA